MHFFFLNTIPVITIVFGFFYFIVIYVSLFKKMTVKKPFFFSLKKEKMKPGKYKRDWSLTETLTGERTKYYSIEVFLKSLSYRYIFLIFGNKRAFIQRIFIFMTTIRPNSESNGLAIVSIVTAKTDECRTRHNNLY